MARQRCGIDLDGVVYEWEAQARAILTARWGVDIPESDHYYAISRDLKARLGPATGEMASSWLFGQEAAQAGMWDGGGETPGAVEAIQRLSLTYDVVFITKRPRLAIPYTWDWLSARALYPLEMIVIPPDQDRGKSTVLCDWYIDDSPAVAEELEKAGRVVYLLDRARNRECPFGQRVADWTGLLERVLRGWQR
jgi:hypothetical protein